METDPQMISAYLIYLSQHAPVEEQASHNDLALVVLLFSAPPCSVPPKISPSVVSASPSAGRGPTYRGALHYHEQFVLQTFVQT